MIILWISDKGPEFDFEITSRFPKRFFSEIFYKIFGYKTDKNVDEIIEILLKVKRRVRILIRFENLTKNLVNYLLRFKSCRSLIFIIKVSPEDILKIKRFRSLVKASEVFYNGKRIKSEKIIKTYNAFPLLVSAILTLYYLRILLHAKDIGYLEIAISSTFFFLIVLRLIVYNIKKD